MYFLRHHFDCKISKIICIINCKMFQSCYPRNQRNIAIHCTYLVYFDNFRKTSISSNHWVGNAKICYDFFASFSLLVIEKKESLIPSLKLKNWFGVHFLQIDVGWLRRLGFARGRPIKRRLMWEKLGIEEELKKSFASWKWAAEM